MIQNYLDVTAGEFDAVFEKYKSRTLADIPEIMTSKMIMEESLAAKVIVSKGVELLRCGLLLEDVLLTVLGTGMCFGWHVRDDRERATTIETLMTEEELTALRRELDREVPVRDRMTQRLLPPVTDGPSDDRIVS